MSLFGIPSGIGRSHYPIHSVISNTSLSGLYFQAQFKQRYPQDTLVGITYHPRGPKHKITKVVGSKRHPRDKFFESETSYVGQLGVWATVLMIEMLRDPRDILLPEYLPDTYLAQYLLVLTHQLTVIAHNNEVKQAPGRSFGA